MDGGEERKDFSVGLSRGQLITWVSVGLVILLVGGNYLRGQIGGVSNEAVVARTTSMTNGVGAGEGGDTGETAASTVIKIHVAGAVVAPGLYELRSGDRIYDALKLAGGALPEADMDMVNLAAKLTDGQQVFVPREGEPPPPGGSLAASGGGAADAAAGQTININTATGEELQQLDGIGEKTAQKIIDYRQEHGAFGSIEELMEVPGIGPAKFENIRESVTV